MRRWALVVSCLLTLCFSGEVSAQQNEVEGKKSRRVVALSSLSADLVVSINPDVLIGVPGSSLTNQDPRYSGLKRVSNGRSQPSVELILALNPDLVIGAEGFHSRVLNALNKLGVQTLAIKVNRWDRLQQASRVLERRIVNAGSLDSRLSKLCPSKKSSISVGNSVLILAGVSPKLSPGQQSWSGSLLDRLGLVNSTRGLPGSSEFSGYITMSNERLLMIKPEKVLVVNPAGDSVQMVRSLIPFFPGLKVSDFKVMDYYGLINPGSLSSIEKACTTLSSL
jgi:iron complex transport system substrate-binding protein